MHSSEEIANQLFHLDLKKDANKKLKKLIDFEDEDEIAGQVFLMARKKKIETKHQATVRIVFSAKLKLDVNPNHTVPQLMDQLKLLRWVR